MSTEAIEANLDQLRRNGELDDKGVQVVLSMLEQAREAKRKRDAENPEGHLVQMMHRYERRRSPEPEWVCDLKKSGSAEYRQFHAKARALMDAIPQSLDEVQGAENEEQARGLVAAQMFKLATRSSSRFLDDDK